MNYGGVKLIILLLGLTQVFLGHAACVTLLDIANSPNTMDSVCSVPYKKVVFEFNYITQQLPSHEGSLQRYPNANIRIGLPSHSEISVVMPNYITQTPDPHSGSSSVFPGFKHTIFYNDRLIFAFEGIANPASGSYYFGSQHWGGTINGLISYSFNSKWTLSSMLGVSRLSEEAATGGNYYNSINPDINLNYSPNDKISLYAELYGQSNIDSVQGAGFNFDGGVLFLIASSTMFNLSVGKQLYHYLGNFTYYANIGISTML
jgi:hypothetical protein